MHSGPLTADGATSRHAWERTWSIDRLVLRQIGRFASGGFFMPADNWQRLVLEFTICSLERCWIEWSVSLRRNRVRINVVLVCRFVSNQALSVFVGRRVALSTDNNCWAFVRPMLTHLVSYAPRFWRERWVRRWTGKLGYNCPFIWGEWLVTVQCFDRSWVKTGLQLSIPERGD